MSILGQIAGALDEAHALGLVHRDVKPANVLLAQRSGHDHAYLTDFGITRRPGDEHLTRTGVALGSVDYIAPEQAHGADVDARADIYSLACILFQMLTGSVVFDREGDLEKLWAHVHDPPAQTPWRSTRSCHPGFRTCSIARSPSTPATASSPRRSWRRTPRTRSGTAERGSFVGNRKRSRGCTDVPSVVSSSGRGLLGRVTVGDDTRAALDGAPCAVAVAPAGYADRHGRRRTRPPSPAHSLRPSRRADRTPGVSGGRCRHAAPTGAAAALVGITWGMRRLRAWSMAPRSIVPAAAIIGIGSSPWRSDASRAATTTWTD